MRSVRGVAATMSAGGTDVDALFEREYALLIRVLAVGCGDAARSSDGRGVATRVRARQRPCATGVGPGRRAASRPKACRAQPCGISPPVCANVLFVIFHVPPT